MNFTLHTEPRASVPEFTLSCRTHGGPATHIYWINPQEMFEHEMSQLILDTTQDSVCDNRVRVKSRKSGPYKCVVNNILDTIFGSITVSGIYL